MRRPMLVRSLILLGMFLGGNQSPCCAAGKGSAPRKSPNVVFILADDLGHSDLGCMGSELHRTPNLDAFAADSLAFQQAYTSPTCSPSRAAILSGKNPASLGIVGHGGIRKMSGGGGEFLAAKEYTIAEALRDAGYDTCHIGKWHIGSSNETRPQGQGFNKVVAANDFCCPGSYFYPFRDKKKSGAAAERSAVPDLQHYSPGDHLTHCLGSEAANYIASRKDSGKPFFLNLWYYAVHTPIEAKKEKVDTYRQQAKQATHQRNPSYAALVEHLDDSVGMVLQSLEDHGLANDTIVIFFSDNGGEIRKGITSNFPLRSGKTTLYEGGIRVPCFIRWPDVVAGGESTNRVIVGHDFYPTLLELTGAAGREDQNAKMDGLDLSPVLHDPTVTLPERSLHWLRYGELVHYRTYRNDLEFGPSGAIRRGGWKLIEHYPTPHGLERTFELFNLRDDPFEEKDLAASEPARVAKLREELIAWQKTIGIPSYEELAYPAFQSERIDD